MGWTVLYIAFGIVALWLLGEVLLQYKARLRWRLLAFVGFLGVVIGVLMPSIAVIAVGAIAFAIGQTYVTLSFRRGFSTGWALGGSPGESRRRKAPPGRQAAQEPTLEVSDLEYQSGQHDLGYAPEQPQGTPFYAPEPMPDDTGQYGVYSDSPAYAGASSYPDDAAYASAHTADDQAYAATAQTDAAYGYDAYAGGYDQQQYGYDTGQQQYAAYADPYAGAQGYAAQPGAQPQQYDGYGGQQQYGQEAYAAQDPYATGVGYGSETPPGGVWVPQQRGIDEPYGGELPPEQPYPYQGQNGNGNGYGYDATYYDTGYNEQYRY